MDCWMHFPYAVCTLRFAMYLGDVSSDALNWASIVGWRPLPPIRSAHSFWHALCTTRTSSVHAHATKRSSDGGGPHYCFPVRAAERGESERRATKTKAVLASTLMYMWCLYSRRDSTIVDNCWQLWVQHNFMTFKQSWATFIIHIVFTWDKQEDMFLYFRNAHIHCSLRSNCMNAAIISFQHDI
jgi:hypothetical protein